MLLTHFSLFACSENDYKTSGTMEKWNSHHSLTSKSKLNEIKLLSFLPHHFTCEYQLMTGCDCQADIVQGDHWDQRGRYMDLDNLAFLA